MAGKASARTRRSPGNGRISERYASPTGRMPSTAVRSRGPSSGDTRRRRSERLGTALRSTGKPNARKGAEIDKANLRKKYGDCRRGRHLLRRLRRAAAVVRGMLQLALQADGFLDLR